MLMLTECWLKFMWFFFFNDTAPPEIYTLPLHDALPISGLARAPPRRLGLPRPAGGDRRRAGARLRRQARHRARSEEHTSELQSRQYLVCRLLLEKKKKKMYCIVNIPLQ